jgi:hypothetical protein
MRDLFPEYYTPSVEEFNELWQKCIFIFDTNVLLDFYEYRQATREDFFKVLEAIKTRLWIPHQVALEYQKNRFKRIIQVQSNFEKVESKFNNAQNELNKTIQIISEDKDFKKCIPPEIFQEVKEEVKKAFETIFSKLTQYKKESIKTNELDYVRDKIADLFQEKIGELPTDQEELNKIYSEGAIRYKMSRPPGFLDEEKKKDKDNEYIHRKLVFQRAYGDLILWKQILKEVNSKQLTHIIFITEDRKEDWWEKKDKKIIGLLPELVEEILEAGASMFYMYTADNFLKYAKIHLNLQIEEKSIEQVEEISVSNSLSKPEVNDNSPEDSLVNSYGLNNIERLALPVGNIQAMIANAQRIQNVASAAPNIQGMIANAQRIQNVASAAPNIQGMIANAQRIQNVASAAANIQALAKVIDTELINSNISTFAE